MPSWLKSKKLWAAVIGVLVASVGGKAGLDLEAQRTVVGVIMAYLVGAGLADVGKERAKVERRVP